VQPSLKVARRRPRDRSKPSGLVGRLRVSLRTCSKGLGDDYDSYLHIGSGMVRVSFDRSLLAKAARARGREDLERIVERLAETMSLDYGQFSATCLGLVVPGSSVKGNVRSRLELSFVPRGDTVRACFIRSSPPRPVPKLGQHGWRHYRIWERALQGHRDACSCTGGWGECEVCILCDLFGTAGLKGLVEFSDFVGADVSIARLDLPTGEKVEAAPPGSRFSGEVTFTSLEPVELGLVLFGIGLRSSRVGKPVLLGKLKYRRDLPHVFGVVRYELERLELAPLSKPLKAGGVDLAPGSVARGEQLDRLVGELVNLAKSEFDGELVDVDEVGAVDRLAAGV